jgi:hypothetical protein
MVITIERRPNWLAVELVTYRSADIEVPNRALITHPLRINKVGNRQNADSMFEPRDISILYIPRPPDI